MNHKLSMIIPCYNCETTLEKAVSSAYTQNLAIPFEVIMVEDGSTDNTKQLILKIAQKYPLLTYYFHDKNKGGGAARNTGIKKATGDLIFCLDSDNFLEKNSLQKMILFLDETKSDGVAFHERRFFKSKTEGKKFNSHFNKIADRPIALSNIFDESETLLDNFLFTKVSYLKTRGYPEHHGFDTQCFEMRYLSAQNKVLVCKDTIFYHRQELNMPSYFEREYNKGNFSINYYLALEDIFHLFSAEAKKFIIGYDIFKNSSLENNILRELAKLQKKDSLFKNETPIRYDLFLQKFREQKYTDAIEILTQIISSDGATKILYYDMMRCALGLNTANKNQIETNTVRLFAELTPLQKKLNRWYHKIPFLYPLYTFLWKK